MSKGKIKSLNLYGLKDAELREIVANLETELKGLIETRINEVSNQIPTALSEMSDDSNHRVVTDQEKTSWNMKADINQIPTKLDDINTAGYRILTSEEFNTLYLEIGNNTTKINELEESDTELENLVNTSVTNMNTAMSLEKTERETAINLEKTNRENADASINAKIYPVGSIYMSIDPTSPASLFGGDWEAIEDKFLLGASSTYVVGATGGEATHLLEEKEIPSHRHLGMYWTGSNNRFGGSWDSSGSNSGWKLTGSWASNMAGNEFRTGLQGGGQAHNNMPPYLAVYMWKRIA